MTVFQLLQVAMLASCANVNFFSDEQLEPLSVQAYNEESSAHQPVTRGAQHDLVMRVASRITGACEEGFPWQTRLLQADETPNAFCLPNGRIAVYTGLLPITANEDGLAIVLGHEVAHAVLRHGGKRMSQDLLTELGLGLAEAGLDASKMKPENKQLALAALGLGAQVGMLLPYSREHESEADELGLRYAIRAGYDPYEAPKLWARMAKLGGDTPEFLSTHPASERRAATLAALIPRLIEEEKNWRKPAQPVRKR